MRPASEAPSPWLAALLATASPAGITRAGERGSGLLHVLHSPASCMGRQLCSRSPLALTLRGQWPLVKKLGAQTQRWPAPAPAPRTHRKGSCPSGGVSAS